MQYLFIFAQAHADFRIPELQSVAELHGFDVLLPQHDLSLDSPFMIADLADAEHARVLASRCILIR
jgi:tRNA (guanine10-N2)-methyltransferase